MRDPSRPPAWEEVRPGLWLMTGLAVVLLAIFFLDEIRRAVEEGPRLVVVTEAAPALQPGSSVWIAGRPAGRVVSVRFREPGAEGTGMIVIEAVLERHAAGVLREDASARIVQSSLMAPVILSLGPGSRERPGFDFADTLRTTVALVDRDRALALVDTLRAEVETARPVAARLRAATRTGDGTLAALRRDSALVGALRRRFRRLETLLFPGPGGEGGALARIVADTALPASVERIALSLERLSDDREAAGTGPAVEELLGALDRLQASLVELERDLAAGRGTVGRLVHDAAIAREAAALRARRDSLRRELFENPLRWLRIRLF